MGPNTRRIVRKSHAIKTADELQVLLNNVLSEIEKNPRRGRLEEISELAAEVSREFDDKLRLDPSFLHKQVTH